MKIAIWFFLLVIFLSSCADKSVTEGLIKFEITSIDGKRKKEIDAQKASKVLKLAEPIDTYYFWKGFRIATFTYQDGSVVDVRVSHHGAFFYAEEFGSFYQFQRSEDQNAWYQLINEK